MRGNRYSLVDKQTKSPKIPDLYTISTSPTVIGYLSSVHDQNLDSMPPYPDSKTMAKSGSTLLLSRRYALEISSLLEV